MSTFEEKTHEILENLKQEHFECLDETTKLGYIARIEEIGSTGWKIGSEPATVTSHAESQLLNRLNIPASYLHRCPEWLMCKNINYWLDVKKDKEVLLRKKKDTVRAIFSSRFSAEFDDYHIFPPIFSAMGQSVAEDGVQSAEVEYFIKASDITICRVRYSDSAIKHDGRDYFAGVHVVNSEIGKSAVWIKPYISLNSYNFIDRSKEGSTRIKHIGEINSEFLIEAVHKAKETAQVGIHKLITCEQEVVHNPAEEIKSLVEASDFLPKRVCLILEDEYKNIERANKLQIAKSILDAVAELPVFQKYLAEREVGRYIDLFSNTKTRLMKIAQDVVDSY